MDALARNTESHQFRLLQLFYGMTVIAIALSIAKLLGTPFGWIAFCPFTILFIQVSLTSNRLLHSAAIGFAIASAIGGLLVDWPIQSVNFFKACFTLGVFGASILSAIRLFWMQRKILGITTLAASVAILLYSICTPISVQ